ncbi:MAG: MMPL family transporter [Puniceicoccales bacterium]|jgi:predicted exporter|nr:MMPL family transporter [Puniceicoccales bacterium]
MSGKSSLLERVHPALARVWLAVVPCIFAALAWCAANFPVETNVMKLLPAAADTAGPPPAVVDAAMRRLDRQLIWLVADDATTAAADRAAPALWWQHQLAALPDLENVAGAISEEQQAEWLRFNLRHGAQRLGTAARQRLRDAPDAWAQWVLAQLYSPFAGVGADELRNDPLLLLRSQATAAGGTADTGITLDKGWLAMRENAGAPTEKTWRMVRAELRGAAFDTEGSRRLVAQLDALGTDFSKRFPKVEVLRRGTLFYSDHAAALARRDMSTVGLASVLGIVLVILLFFRSPRPLWLALLSTGVGVGAGVAGMFLVFGQVHIISLVLSTSVVGVSVDYALHFLTARMLRSAEETPMQTLAKLLPVLGMAMLTSALAYMVLVVTPFPGLRQLAVCAGFGLGAAFATVFCWFPFLSKNMPARRPAGIVAAMLWLRLWRRNRALRFGLPAVCAAVGLAGLAQTVVNDDVALLQGMPETLLAQERRVAGIMGRDIGGQSWLVVHGATGEEVLRRLEAVEPELERGLASGQLKSFQLLSRQLPSLARQRESHALVVAAAPAVLAKLREAEVEIEQPKVADFSPLTPTLWLGSFASEGWRHFWFEENGVVAAFVPVTGASVGQCAVGDGGVGGGVHWLNRRAELSGVLAVYRQSLCLLLGVAVLLVCGFFVVRFGVAAGVRCSLPIIIAMTVALSAPALLGLPLNLFSILALVLVLGIGIDYTLFFANSGGGATTAMLSVSVCAATTQLAFGMLVLSSTPAIRGFGAVLAAGIFVAFVLAPLAAPLNFRSQRTSARQ